MWLFARVLPVGLLVQGPRPCVRALLHDLLLQGVMYSPLLILLAALHAAGP